MADALSAIVLFASCGWSAYVIAARCYPASGSFPVAGLLPRTRPAVHPSPAGRAPRSGPADTAAVDAAGLTSARLAAATLVCYWSLTAVFLALAAAGQFRIGIAMGVWLAIAAALHAVCRGGRHARAALRIDLERVAAVGREWRESWPAVVALVAIAALVAVRLVRSLLAPPLGWDSFTYHLVKPASWVQTGSW